MAISQQQIVDYLNKKLGYGVAKTDVYTAKNPSNEANASPLLSVGNTIWQLSNLIPTLIPADSNSIVEVYSDSLSTTVQCTIDNTTSVNNQTWRTNLIDWIPPQFGSTYQVKVYAAPAGTSTPQTTGTQLFPDGSGNNDGWFFDYQAGILNFADTNIPASVAGNVIYIVGARYVGQKGISNFPLGLAMGNVLISGNAIVGNLITTNGLFWANGTSALGTFSNASLAAYLNGNITTGNITTTSLSTTNGIFWANGINYSSTVQGLYGNANVASYLPSDSIINSIIGNLGGITANTGGLAAAQNSINANLGLATNNISSLFSITVALDTKINYSASTANTNTAAYLAAGVTSLAVTGNSSVGGNLTVFGNLIVQGNSYVLQTEIVASNEVVSNSIYAQSYFYANGTPLNYGNVQVAAYLPTYTGPLGSSDITTLYANAAQQANQIIGANNRVQVLDANLGIVTTSITTLLSNAGIQAGQIQVLDANIGTASVTIGQLTANAAAQSFELSGLRANIILANANISVLFANVAGITNNLGWLTSNVNSINANLGAYQIYANANLGVTSLALNSLQNNNSAYQIYANANLGTATTNISALQANLGAYQVFANANIGTTSINLNSLLANVGAYQITANANLGAYQGFANANAVAQQAAINSLQSGANANTAAYLLRNTITIGGNSDATSANTGVLQVWGGASIGANLYVAGNLVVAGNSYVLQTEILTQNEVITGNIYAGAYFFANGAQFTTSSYSNANVASYLPTYFGNLSPGNLTVRGNLYVANLITTGKFGNINNVDTISANNFVFGSNSVNIITAILNQTYSNTNTQAYLSGTVTIGNIITTSGLFWSNGVSALTPSYGNTQVAAYLTSYTGNIGAGNVNATTVNTTTVNTTTVNTTTVNTANIITGNITAGNVMSNGALRVTANATVGNIIASQFFWANGTVFSSSNYGNANVATYLAGLGSNPINTSGNVTVGNLISSGNVFGQNFIGNVTSTGNITARFIQTSGLFGNITGANVISANSFVFGGNGVNILSVVSSLVPTYSNANVRTYLASFGSNVITTTGNITAGNIITGNITASNFNSAGNITAGNFNSAGNITVGNINTARVNTSNILSNSYLYANGVSILSGIGGTYSNSNVQSYMANFGSNIITTTGAIRAGNVTASNLIATAHAFIGNLTVYGTIDVANIVVTNTEIVYTTEQVQGNAFVTGNTTTGNLLTNSLRYANGNPYQFGTTYSNANVASYLPIYSGNLTTTNITTGNISVTNNVTTTNLTIQNLTTLGSYGNISGANVILANTFAFNGNGVNILNAFTAIATSYGNANVAGYLSIHTGNVSANNVFVTANVVTGNVLTTSLRYANGEPYSFGSTYSNANVEAYLIVSPVITGIQANLGAYQIFANANAATQATGINALNANVGTYQIATNANIGAYQVFANANAAGQATNINTINANLGTATTNVSALQANIGAYQIFANANAATQATGINTINANVGTYQITTNANLGAYQVFANANAATQATSITTTNANLGAFQTYANLNFGTSSYSNVDVSAYLAAGSSRIVVATGTQASAANTGALQVWGGASVGANLYVAGNLIVAGNSYVLQTEILASNEVVSNSIYAQAYFYGNGTPLNYGNVQVSAYLSTNADPTISNLNANAAGQATALNTLNANVGAYQIYANANLGTATTNVSALQANLGAYQIFANANAATQATGINTINANLGTYQITTNANLGSYQNITNANLGAVFTRVNTLDANVGAYMTWANATFAMATGPTTIELSANLGAYQVFANANVGAISTALNTLTANVGSYQNTTNANLGTATTNINSINANIGAYQIFANANAAGQATSINALNANLGTATTNINSINANIGAYQIFANANIGTISTAFNTISANLGAYQTFANANVGAISTALNTLTANVGAYQTFANANAAVQAVAINSLYINANANTAAYLPLYIGNIGANINSSAASVAITAGSNTWKFNTDGTWYAPGRVLIDGAVTINTGSGASDFNDLYIGGDTGWVSGESHGINWFYGSKTSPTTLARLDTSYDGAKATMRWKNLYYAGSGSSTVMTLSSTSGNTADLKVFGNVGSTVLLTDNILYANGNPYVFGTTYANANVAAYLTTYTGNISVGNIAISANVYTDHITTRTGSISLVPASTGVILLNANTAVKLPAGTTADRPGGVPGYLRFNTDFNGVEYYDGETWQAAINSITEQLLTGDGVSKDFTLNQLTNAVGILVSINGTVQTPNVAYTVSGTQITFAEAPQATDYVDVRYLVSASATIADVMIVSSGNVALGTSTAIVDSWSLTDYRSAKYVISSSTGTESQITEILLTHNGSTGFISNTTLKTGANRIDFTASVASGNVLLQAVSTTTGNQLRIQRTYFDI